MKEWKLVGYDSFEGTYYPLEGTYPNLQATREAGVQRLKHLNEVQPPEHSGGQNDIGIQDRVFIQRPDGTRQRFLPTPEEFG